MTSFLFKILIGMLFFFVIVYIVKFYFTRSHEKTLAVGKEERTYYEYKPFSKTAKMPVVIMIHGYGDSPRLMELYSGMNTKARMEGFTVIYPAGLSGDTMKKSWNAGFCCGYSYDKSIDDVAFIEALVDELRDRTDVDPNRIYVAGFSNGGMLTHALAQSLTGKVAALAVSSGAIGNKNYTVPSPGSPIPVILLHGTDDTVVPIDGKKSFGGYTYKTLKEAESFWVKNNSCTSEPLSEETEQYVRTDYSCTNPVVTYTVKDRGHFWFGGLAELLHGNFKNNFNATDTVWEFFKDKHLQP